MNFDERQRRFEGPRLLPVPPAPSTLAGSSFACDTNDAFTGNGRLAAEVSRELSRLVNIEERFLPLRHSAASAAQMSFVSFVQTKFVPGHVAHKTLAGQTHYKAILKHLLTPELVSQIFKPGPTSRLRAVADWPYLDKVLLCDITAEHVHRIIRAANEGGYSSQTVKHIKNVLFAIMAHAQKEGCYAGPNPAGMIKLPKVVRWKQQNLTFQQTKAILESLQYPAKEIAAFTIATGMTLGEICDLKWKYVNLTSSELFVDGETIPGRSLAVKKPYLSGGPGSDRAGKESRMIGIPEPLFSILCELRRQVSFSKADDDVVIATQKDTPSLVRACTGQLKGTGKLLGIPWLTWQALRRARTSIVGEFLSYLKTPLLLEDSPAPLSAAISENRTGASSVISRGMTRNGSSSHRRRTFCFGERLREA
jgi:integrase